MIIITGYKGFIGSNFHKTFDNEVILVEREDCFNFINTFNEWEKVTLIIHQGAISHTTEKNINLLHQLNVDFTLKLLQKAIDYQITIKYASSASVYGNNTDGIVSPLNYYAISKLQIDYFVLDNIDKFKLIQGFRYFNVYGSTEYNKGNQASPIYKFRKQIKEQGYIELFENSENYLRDFICINDIIQVVLTNKAKSGIYDLGTANPISFKEIANTIINSDGGYIKEIPMPDILKGKYQTYTCANMHWLDYNFKTVKQYINNDT
jgi:ADP-L-glycero-D-manno-heptose 6-epimerase